MTSKEKAKYRAGKHFKNLRLQLIKEAENCCSLCGVRKPSRYLQIHHVNPDKYKAPDEADYCVVLCSECHKYLEHKIIVLTNHKNKQTPYTEILKNIFKDFTSIEL
jgi:5-methylcytosine-specific restriction endonuclease McrA